MTCCPTCGQTLPPRFRIAGYVRPRIVHIVANRPDGITNDELVRLVYGDVDGGPKWAGSSVSAMIFQANRELRRQGYQIRGSGGPGSRYFLERVNGK